MGAGCAERFLSGSARGPRRNSSGLLSRDAVAVNGNIAAIWRPGTGTYTLNSDCTGTMTLINQGQAPLHLAILVSHSGDLIHTVVTVPGFAVTSDAGRVLAPED